MAPANDSAIMARRNSFTLADATPTVTVPRREPTGNGQPIGAGPSGRIDQHTDVTTGHVDLANEPVAIDELLDHPGAGEHR